MSQTEAVKTEAKSRGVEFVRMLFMNFIWGAIGIVLGILTNNFTIHIFNSINLDTKFLQNVIQLFIGAAVLSILHVFVNSYFGWTWQNITPGLFFVSFFFGVQYKLFSNLSDYILPEI